MAVLTHKEFMERDKKPSPVLSENIVIDIEEKKELKTWEFLHPEKITKELNINGIIIKITNGLIKTSNEIIANELTKKNYYLLECK